MQTGTAGRRREDPGKRLPTYKPRREVSEGTNPVNILVLNFQPPQFPEDKFLLVGPPSLWYFGMAALAD